MAVVEQMEVGRVISRGSPGFQADLLDGNDVLHHRLVVSLKVNSH